MPYEQPSPGQPGQANNGLVLFALATAVIAGGIWAVMNQDVWRGSSAPSSSQQPAPTPTPVPEPAPTSAEPTAKEPKRVARRLKADDGTRPAEVEPAVTPPPVVPAPAAAPVQVVPKPTAGESVEPADARPVSTAPATVFDATSSDVTPPALLTPVANAPVRPGARYEPGSAAIEILVNDDGSVSSVKAASQPATIGDTLAMINWLSITKSWRFNPAVRNGQPVKYRMYVPLAALVAGRVNR
jgi:outer membrane biosynthesis protein TonB